MHIFGVLYLASLVTLASSAGFLESKLPLTVTVTTPYELLTVDSVELSDLQTITVRTESAFGNAVRCAVQCRHISSVSWPLHVEQPSPDHCRYT
jgi:hypothetical protein